MTDKKCYTLVQKLNKNITITMRNHNFERPTEEDEFSTCTKCGVVVNQDYIKYANKQTNGGWLKGTA